MTHIALLCLTVIVVKSHLCLVPNDHRLALFLSLCSYHPPQSTLTFSLPNTVSAAAWVEKGCLGTMPLIVLSDQQQQQGIEVHLCSERMGAWGCMGMHGLHGVHGSAWAQARKSETVKSVCSCRL